jgi:hypothetical protein
LQQRHFEFGLEHVRLGTWTRISVVLQEIVSIGDGWQATVMAHGRADTVDDDTVKPWLERTRSVEAPDVGRDGEKRFGYRILRDLAVATEVVGHAESRQLISVDEEIQPRDVSAAERINSISFLVHVQPFSRDRERLA